VSSSESAVAASGDGVDIDGLPTPPWYGRTCAALMQERRHRRLDDAASFFSVAASVAASSSISVRRLKGR